MAEWCNIKLGEKMKTINYAVKWWMDILTNANHYNSRELEKRIEAVESYQDRINELKATINKNTNMSNEDIEFLKYKVNALENAVLEEKETLEDEIDFLENMCEYVKPERREVVETYFAEFVAENMHKDKNRCVYLFTDEEGVARLTLGLFCLNTKIRNDNTKLSPLPVGVEMWVTPKAVEVRFNGEDKLITLFEDKVMER